MLDCNFIPTLGQNNTANCNIRKISDSGIDSHQVTDLPIVTVGGVVTTIILQKKT